MGTSSNTGDSIAAPRRSLPTPLLGVVSFLLFACALCLPTPAFADFGVETFTATAREEDGTIAERAASHPFALEVHLAMNTKAGEPDGTLRRIQIDLPPGLVGNPLAAPRCAKADFEAGFSPRCPGSTQIGILRGIIAGLGQVSGPLYNLTPSPGSVGAFGLSINGEAVIEQLQLSGAGSDSAVRFEATLPPSLGIVDVEEVIWGTPAAAAHDPERICQASDGGLIEGCASGAEPRSLLTLPSSCAGPLRSELTATSLGPPALSATATALSHDAGGNPRPLAACEVVPFDPRLTLAPDAPPLAPTGLHLKLGVPQYEGAPIAAANLFRLRLALPPGLSFNPAGAGWLQGCPAAAIGLRSAPGSLPPDFDPEPPSCPPGSRLGTITVRTPLLDHPLGGLLYLAAPNDNPYGERFAIYLVIEDPAISTALKFGGSLEPDPLDARLTATIADLPPFPFSELELDFDAGARAPLANPSLCGTYTADALLEPSSSPAASALTRRPTFTLTHAADGQPCPPPPSERPIAPAFQAGTTVPLAGAETPLLIRLSRLDTDQHLGSFELTLPPGLLAATAGAVCPQAAIAAARAASGLTETEHPSCLPDSAIGSVQLGAGIGPQPLQLPGTVYMAGPYRGAPYSLAIVVPARAGPFDLGTLVLRVALFIDPHTLQLTARSDRLPEVLAGVPLELRSLAIELGPAALVHNPTSCEPMAISGVSTTSLGQSSPLSERFQVGACAALGLRPALAIALTGGLARNAHPGAILTVKPRRGDANLSDAGFTLPAGELLDLRHLSELCDPATPPELCPPGSRLGNLRLFSPLLGSPLEGPIYLRTPRRGLPEFLADLHSGPLRATIRGYTASPGGRLRIRFPDLPDLPLTRAAITLAGARRGIIVNSQALCGQPIHANADLAAHNGVHSRPRVRVSLRGHC
jgi:hypothetical protein